MAARKYGLYINGQYVHTRAWRPVAKSHQPEVLLGEVSVFDSRHDDPDLLQATLDGLFMSFEQMRDEGFFPLEERLSFLRRLQARLEDQKENLAQLMTHEVGKPIALSRAEVERGIDTLHWTIACAPEVLGDRPLPFAGRPGWENFEGVARRQARGPLLAISPFNFPLNLVLHKIAPAIAAGCPVLLKPSVKAALSALCLIDYCHAEGLPPGLLNLFSCTDEDAQKLLRDDRIKQVSFTGSAAVGWKLKQGSTLPFTLELGGAAPAFVAADANLEQAAGVLAKSALNYAGQTCISTQSILVESSAYVRFMEHFAKAFHQIPWGDPIDETVVSGPVIDSHAYDRIQKLLKDVSSRDGRIVETQRAPTNATKIEARLVRPAFILNLPETHSFWREECFAPLVALRPVDNLEAFVRFANELPHRLQCSIWGDPQRADIRKALDRLDYGGVILNDSPSVRFDAMPYGGRGLAGAGREGPRYALEEFTDLKSIVEKR
jgi:acyl-CoA reductase-like NAD-dependent aldehyde dehydrogenase